MLSQEIELWIAMLDEHLTDEDREAFRREYGNVSMLDNASGEMRWDTGGALRRIRMHLEAVGFHVVEDRGRALAVANISHRDNWNNQLCIIPWRCGERQWNGDFGYRVKEFWS